MGPDTEIGKSDRAWDFLATRVLSLYPNGKCLIALLHRLLKFDPGRFSLPLKQRPPRYCTCCGALMEIVRTRILPDASASIAAFLAAPPATASVAH